MLVPASGGTGVDVIAILDIDGVLADASHRQHLVARPPKDWDAFFAAVGGDEVIERGRQRLLDLSREHEIVLLSGRPERSRADSVSWLERQGIAAGRVVLRPDDDHRPASTLKAELIRLISDPVDTAVVIDDDVTVVDRLRGMGYRTELFA